MIDAVLFDLDETLTDRTASLARYAARFHRDFAGRLRAVGVADLASTFLGLDQRGYRPREEVYAGILRHLPWHSPPDLAVVRDHWRSLFPASAVARAGMQETLHTLTDWGLRLGVVTNGSVMTQSAKLERLQITKYCSSTVISEALGCEKPDPRIFHRALAEIGSEAATTWFVGDHPANDVAGAAAAGLVPVWLEGIHPWPPGHPHPERRILALLDLLPLVGHEHRGRRSAHAPDADRRLRQPPP